MNEVPNQELLSAYLDGEVTADEKAHVERWLAADAEARQLLDDLRAVSAGVRRLPPQTLGEDLSQRVLRTAERRMLTGRPPAAPEPVEPTRPLWRELSWRGMLSRRALVWSGLAVAIALMFHWFDTRPKGPDDRAVALKEQKPDSTGPINPAGPPPEIQASAGAALAQREAAADKTKKIEAEEKAAHSRQVVTDRSAEKRPEAAAAPAGPPGVMSGGRVAAGPPLPSARATLSPERNMVATNVLPNRSRPPSFKASGAVPASRMMVVEMEVRPQAVAAHAFEQLLRDNGLAFRHHGAESRRGQRMGTTNAATPDAGTADKAGAGSVPMPRVLTYEVEATQKQVDQFLVQLNDKPDAFAAVAVKSPSGKGKSLPAGAMAKQPSTAADRQNEESKSAGSQGMQSRDAAGAEPEPYRVVFRLRVVEPPPAAQTKEPAAVPAAKRSEN